VSDVRPRFETAMTGQVAVICAAMLLAFAAVVVTASPRGLVHP
jgi:hypothetical protein